MTNHPILCRHYYRNVHGLILVVLSCSSKHTIVVSRVTRCSGHGSWGDTYLSSTFKGVVAPTSTHYQSLIDVGDDSASSLHYQAMIRCLVVALL